MPSNKNPITVVLPGAGRLPASTISASAFIVPGGGGGGGSMAALMAHINDPIDAHMAGAIGIPPVYPATGEPLLASNVPPGVIDGESVLDFIAQFKDLIPVRPAYLGFPGGTNSMVPSWGAALDPDTRSAYNNGAGSTVYTHYSVQNGIATFTLTGNLFPADRGVLALYRKTDGNFANPFSNCTLAACLYLGTTLPAAPGPLPAGIPVAGFDEGLRPTGQPDYVPSLAGVDLIGMAYRLPYLKAYPGGVPYAPYDQNFYSYQLAQFTVPQNIAAGFGAASQDWFVVHWRSTFATSKNAIDPAITALNLASLSAANCYSATPTAAADFDDFTKPVHTLNRHHVFRDTASIVLPTKVSFTSALTANTHPLSGVSFYDRTGPVTLNLTAVVADLFRNAFKPGFSAPIPADFTSAPPMDLYTGDFGDGSYQPYDYTTLDNGAGPLFGPANPPAVGDNGRLVLVAKPITPVPFTMDLAVQPGSIMKVNCRNVWSGDQEFRDTNAVYLWNSWDATGNAGVEGGYNMEVAEKFVDESYRYVSLHTPVAVNPIKPVGVGVAYDSTTSLVADTDSLQVVGNRLVYPQVNFSVGYAPAGPDYSVLPPAEVTGLRRYMRVFNTGVPRNTGKLRIRGLSATNFQVAPGALYDGFETTGHTAAGRGALIHIMVPGVTGWLDLGRGYGDPLVGTADFYGCATATVVSGGDVIVSFNTTAFTSENIAGSGKFPLFVRVSYYNPTGLTLALDELEWLAP